MAPRSVARRVAESYLAELLEDDHLPTLLPTPDGEIPTASIVDRILNVGAIKIERKRVREHGEIIVLTFAIEPTDVIEED